MRKLLVFILLVSTLILSMIVSCIPSGYEGGNPTRPPGQENPPVENTDNGTTDQGAGGDEGTADTNGGGGENEDIGQ